MHSLDSFSSSLNVFRDISIFLSGFCSNPGTMEYTTPVLEMSRRPIDHARGHAPLQSTLQPVRNREPGVEPSTDVSVLKRHVISKKIGFRVADLIYMLYTSLSNDVSNMLSY